MIETGFNIFLTNLGKYNEGELVGEWVSLPIDHDELQEVLKRIGIGSKDIFGQPYEEWFITDYDIDVSGISERLGEYTNLDELNYLASRLDELSKSELEDYEAILESGLASCRDIEDLINLTYNIDNYCVWTCIMDNTDLGNMYFSEFDEYQMRSAGLEYLINYIDMDEYGKDIAMSEGGEFTSRGYVHESGESYYPEYSRKDGVPEEYQIIADC